MDTPNPRVNILQNRWRLVWRMSVERKKKLQDTLDHLLEVKQPSTASNDTIEKCS